MTQFAYPPISLQYLLLYDEIKEVPPNKKIEIKYINLENQKLVMKIFLISILINSNQHMKHGLMPLKKV